MNLNKTLQQRKQDFKRAMFQKASAHMLGQKTARSQQLRSAACTFTSTTQKNTADLTVGIVGGGMAGLYAALLLQDQGIDFHIFEADPERPGGRVLTHYFNDDSHQYAELGAMRFPDSELQSRLFSTWDYLNSTVGATPGAAEIRKIPYILHDAATAPDAGNLMCFNGQMPVTRNQVEADNSTLGFDGLFQGPEWDYFKDAGALKPAQDLLDAVVQPFLDKFEDEGIDLAWDYLLQWDAYSARGYMQELGDGTQPYPSRIVDYIETVVTYTGIFDLAFVELVLDQFSFSETDSWYAMDDGTARITDELINRIPAEKITMGARVVGLSETTGQATISYRSSDGGALQTASFDRVIETLPFSILRFIETPASWSAGKYEAMRMLKMTNSTKIALGFKSRFWEQSGPYSQGMAGGQSDTDLAVRSVVYPSFGIGEAGPAYLLGSYCWQNDADKFSHLSKEALLAAALKDVAVLHGDQVYGQYLGDGASVVWNREQYAGGAFEFFASGQFGDLFHAACEPEGRFHFAGEHLDMVHYWIAGAFNSAYRTVWEALILEGLDSPENMDILESSMGGGEIFPSMVPTIALTEVRTSKADSPVTEAVD